MPNHLILVWLSFRSVGRTWTDVGGRERRRNREKVAFSMTKMQRAAHTKKKSAKGRIPLSTLYSSAVAHNCVFLQRAREGEELQAKEGPGNHQRHFGLGMRPYCGSFCRDPSIPVRPTQQPECPPAHAGIQCTVGTSTSTTGRHACHHGLQQHSNCSEHTHMNPTHQTTPHVLTVLNPNPHYSAAGSTQVLVTS